MATLLNKLRMLDAQPKKAAPSAPKPAQADAFYRTQAVFPLSLLADQRHIAPDVLQSLFGFAFPAQLTVEDILFLDTETTGLSGGVGTVAFQIGIGYFTRAGFVVEQFLMRDYPEEAAMLHTLNALMKRFSVLCTFNGRTFDVPLLKSRLLMNRISDDHFPEIHADALYPARRLWKLRLKRCTLEHLEEQLLQVKREDDLPGALVPQTYFQYLKDGNFAPLQRILEHNKQDIISLAQLLCFMCRQASQPESIADGEDLFSLAKAMERYGTKDKAMHCYRLSTKTCMRSDSFAAMARMEKRSGHIQSAVKLYQSMLQQGGDAICACEGLAKLYEHQLHDLPAAISYTRQALLLLSEPALHQRDDIDELRQSLQYRYTRLRRKLQSSSSSSCVTKKKPT